MNQQEISVLKEEVNTYYKERADNPLWCGGSFLSKKLKNIKAHVDKSGNLQKAEYIEEGTIDYFKPAKE